jgi:hypothetical protein
MAEEEKRPRWENEGWAAQQVSANIVCKTCAFRFSEINGEKREAPESSECEMYEHPDSKPEAVYFNGSECEYYEKQE